MRKMTMIAAAAGLLLGGQIAGAQAPAAGEAPTARPAIAEAYGEGRREGRGARMTTATVERTFNRRLAAWEAAKVPAEKIAKAKEVQGKISAAVEKGEMDEVRSLTRSIQELLTPEEREAVQGQMRTNRRGRGGDAATTPTAEAKPAEAPKAE